MTIFSRFLGAVFFILSIFSTTPVFAGQTLLSPAQNTWLDQHKRTIVVRPQDSESPYVFMGSGTTKESKGFSVDLLQAVMKKINATTTFLDPAPLGQVLAAARERNEGIILSLTPTDEREHYLYFTDSYYETPAVIAVRKDFNLQKTVGTLGDFVGKKVAVGSGYAVEGYIKTNYPSIRIVSVPDDQIGLQRLLLGDVDAVVMDFGSLSYYTSNDVLSYVKLAGRTGFTYKHSIGVPKSSPELVLILNEGLKSLSDAEKQVIVNKWLQMEIPDSGDFYEESRSSTSTLSIWLMFAAFVVFIIATIVVVVLLRRKRYKDTHASYHAQKIVAQEVEEELEELRSAREVLKNDMEHISSLEKDIEKKLEDSQ
jgi:ABC-type amino acid transport substrate-binding protein